MPEKQVQPQNIASTDVPKPFTGDKDALLKIHNITPDEYALIEKALGRTPSLTELGIYSVMWSEHCSYKSSKVHLKRLPTKSELVVQGPGENAGIIDVGDGWACAFKIESHNHPSYIEPYQGAATGVGGILRDIFTMGARPLAVMDALRFGPLDESEPDEKVRARNRQIMEGVVHGVAGYGNCFGVPNLGGETRFERCYSGNPLLNAFALGLVRRDEIFYAKATGVGNPVIYVGAKTGRDGIHGATMASEEFKEGSEQKRPNVQMGDPFMEKLLLEACLEVMALPSKAVLGIQDMGAAGLTCSTCEMGARGGVGLEIELDLVPQREQGMSSYEIMLSESQERMLLVAEKGKEQEVLDVFAKWGLDAAIVGEVIAENRMRVRHHGELIADISNESLTDDAPLYNRPVGEWKSPFPAEAPAHILEELKQPRNYTADLKKLLASANICDKSYIFEQYDSMVQTNTVFGPGGAEAGVMRIKGTGSREQGTENSEQGTDGFVKGTASAVPSSAAKDGALAPEAKPERGLAMALAGNGRWTAMNPKLGAMHAVAEACRKVACVGAKPVAATNNLNFGNPMKPEIMGQLSAAVDGIAEACTALGTPITGGNVSLYNETNIGGKVEGIYPTPVMGIVGIHPNVTKAVTNRFVQRNDEIILLSGAAAVAERSVETLVSELGSSAFAQSVLGTSWGTLPALDLKDEAALHQVLQKCVADELVTAVFDISDGGLAVALAKACIQSGIGCEIFPSRVGNSIRQTSDLFAEGSAVIVTGPPGTFVKIEAVTAQSGRIFAQHIGITGGDQLRIPFEDASIKVAVAELASSFTAALTVDAAEEVLA